MKNFKYGVSLMTLIITIVIMSILTGTIIISITNSNTIDNAKDAVKRYTLAEVNQFANVAYGEAVMDKLTNTEEILKFIKAELKEYGIDILLSPGIAEPPAAPRRSRSVLMPS